MCRVKGLRPVQGCLFEDAGLANASESGVLAPAAPAAAPIERHETAAASAGVICLSDSDQDAPAACGGVVQSSPQSLQACKHPRSKQVSMQPKAPLSPLGRYSMSKLPIAL